MNRKIICTILLSMAIMTAFTACVQDSNMDKSDKNTKEETKSLDENDKDDDNDDNEVIHGYYASEEGCHMELNDDMTWYKYDSDNLFGISATVYDGHNITYVFDIDRCLFDEDDVKNAFADGKIYGCGGPGVNSYEVKSVIYEENGENVQLTLTYANDVNMEKVDGFWFHFSNDEYIRCGYTMSTMYIDHIEVKERHHADEGGESYDWASGDDWTQSWNLEDSGKWSNVRNRHYHWDNMPLE